MQKISDLTVVLVTHDINEAKTMANKILIMNEGKIIQYGAPLGVITKPLSIEAAKSMNLSNVFPKEIGSRFTDQNIQSFIRFNPNKIDIRKWKQIEKGLGGIILSIIPEINAEIKIFVIQLTVLNDQEIIIHVHKDLDYDDFKINEKVRIELQEKCLQYFN